MHAALPPIAESRKLAENAQVRQRAAGARVKHVESQLFRPASCPSTFPDPSCGWRWSASASWDGAWTRSPCRRASGRCSTTAALALRCGHKPVRAKDTPGFIVNPAGRGYGTEALRILGEGVAEFHGIDRILRDCAGFRLGPFELLDLTGLDVSHPVMESIYRQYYEEPRFRPSPLTSQRVAAGLFGRKSGVGFYRHENGRQEEIPEPPAPASRPASVWVSRSGLGARLAELVAKLGARVDAGA